MSAPKPLPSSNRILTAGWQAAEHAAHQARLSKVKAQVDSTPPTGAKIKLSRDKKRIAHEANLQRIDRENQILLERMSIIQSKPSPGVPSHADAVAASPTKKASLNSFVRLREQERILEENQALVARLKRGRGHFSPEEFARHEREYRELREAASVARAAPAPMPVHKHVPSTGASTPTPHPTTLEKMHADSDRSLPSLRSPMSLAKSRSAGLLTPLNRPASGGLAASTSSKSIGRSPVKGARPVRPYAELHDDRGPVRAILCNTYPSPAQSHHAQSHHAVQLKHDGRKRVDGRTVMVTVEELTAVTPEDAKPQSAVSDPANPRLLHSLLFRTYDHARLTHDYISIPWSIISSLPELTQEPELAEDAHREQLAERMIGRLRFHDHRLAFAPSHAFRIDRTGEAVVDDEAFAPHNTPSVATTTKKQTRTSVSPVRRPHTSGGGAGSGSTWDQITIDGRLEESEELAEEDPAAPGTISPDLGMTPRDSSPSKPRRGHATHHLATTTATLVRANVNALMVERTIRARHEEAARRKDFDAHRQKSPQRHASPSKTPAKHAQTAAAATTTATTSPDASTATPTAPAAAPTPDTTSSSTTTSDESKEQS